MTDLHNLSFHQPYNGDVLVADGSSLAITYMGSKILSSQTRDLQLHKVLCVPDNRNLISVYRLCNTNQVSVAILFCFLSGEGFQHGDPITPRQN